MQAGRQIGAVHRHPLHLLAEPAGPGKLDEIDLFILAKVTRILQQSGEGAIGVIRQLVDAGRQLLRGQRQPLLILEPGPVVVLHLAPEVGFVLQAANHLDPGILDALLPQRLGEMVPVHQPVTAIRRNHYRNLFLFHQLVELLCAHASQCGLGLIDLDLADAPLGRVQGIDADLAPVAHRRVALARGQRPGTLAQHTGQQ